jgi:hypothetical protein
VRRDIELKLGSAFPLTYRRDFGRSGHRDVDGGVGAVGEGSEGFFDGPADDGVDLVLNARRDLFIDRLLNLIHRRLANQGRYVPASGLVERIVQGLVLGLIAWLNVVNLGSWFGHLGRVLGTQAGRAPPTFAHWVKA